MFGILVDKDGFKLIFDTLDNLQGIELQDGESIIERDWAIANSMNKPRWVGTQWVDTEPLPEPEKLIADEIVGDEEIAMAEATIDLHEEIEELKLQIQLLKGE